MVTLTTSFGGEAMPESTKIEELRTTFRNAYEAYIREGCEMRDLLTADDMAQPERMAAIKVRQARVDAAKADYEHARAAYVEHVLGGLASSGGVIL